MDAQSKAALIISQAACMLAELEGMKAANADRAMAGMAPVYGENAFCQLPDRYQLGYNTVLRFLEE